MHIQEEQYLWDKMLEEERSKGSLFITNLVIKAYADLFFGGSLWQAEMYWMSTYMSTRNLFPVVKTDRSFIDYFDKVGSS